MKKIISIILLLIICITSFVGCGKNANLSSDSTKNDKETIETDSTKWVLVRATSCGNVLGTDNIIKLVSGQSWTGNCHYSQSWEYIYTYDKNGNMLTSNKKCTNGDSEKEEWTYNENGDELSYIVYKNEIKSRETYWTYHKNGKKATYKYVQYKLKDQSVSNLTEEIYDTHGNTTESLGKTYTNNSVNEIRVKSVHTYNNDLLLSTDSETFNSATNSTVISKTVYEYTDGKLTNKKVLNQDGVVMSNSKYDSDDDKTDNIPTNNLSSEEIKIERDDKGNIIKEEKLANVNNQKGYVITYEYKNNGKLSLKKDVNYDSNYIKIYEYDKNGNLSKYTVEYTASNANGYGYTSTFEYEKMQ